MIYTVTLNPSIDYVVTMDKLVEGMVNRVSTENYYPGGKGINVSQILKELGYENTALGYVSGFTGAFIADELNSKGIHSDFIKLPNGHSRINMKINAGVETEINGVGPVVSTEAVQQLFTKLDELKAGDVLVLAGSIPGSLPEDFYEQIMKHLSGREIRIVVDATKNLLLNVLKYNPFLIKPNHHEIAEMFNVQINGTEDLITYGKKLKELGAQNVLISRGGDGALLLTKEGQIYESNVPKGVVKNSVGAGDSMVAGFIAGYLKEENYAHALQLGAASGSATAFSSDVAAVEYINELIKEINIQQL